MNPWEWKPDAQAAPPADPFSPAGAFGYSGSPPTSAPMAGSITAPAPPSASGILTADDLAPLGFSEGGLGGVMQNIGRESGGRTTATAAGGRSYGAGQWTDERQDQLRQFAEKQGLDVTKPSTQAAFLKYDLETNYPDLLADLRNPKTTREHAESRFRLEYERPKAVYAAGNVRFSDSAITAAENLGSYTGTQTVRYMDPADVLALGEDLKDPWTDRQGKDLKKSLANNEPIDELPSMTIKGNKVTDLDGRHRALAAQEAGVTMMPVVIKGSGDKLPSELVGLSGRSVNSERIEAGKRPGAEMKPWEWKPEGETGAGMAERIGRSFASPVIELSRAINHILVPPVLDQALFGGGVTAKSDVTSAENERRIAELRGGDPEKRGEDLGPDWLRMGTDVTNPVNYLYGPVGKALGVAERAIPIVTGLFSALSQPTPEGEDYWWNKEVQGTLGMLGGAAANALASLVRPMTSAASKLVQQGINALPGQLGGEGIRTAE